METIRRSQRVGRSRLVIETSVESTPAAIEQKRLPSARKALVDVTNIKSYGPSRCRVAKKDLNETGNRSILEPATDTELPKTDKKGIGSRAITSLSLKISKNIPTVDIAKDSTVKAPRVRKTKEQVVVVDSKVASTPILNATRMRKTKEQAVVVGGKLESTPILNEVTKTAAVLATPKESVSKTNRVRRAKEAVPVVDRKGPSVPIPDDVSNITSALGTPKDPVVKIARGRKAKEQVQSESNSSVTHVSDGASIGISTSKQKTSGLKSRRKLAKEDSPVVVARDTGASKEKLTSNLQKRNYLEQENRPKTSRISKGLAEKSSGLGEAHSELKTTLMKPKRAIKSKKGVDNVASPELSSGKNAKLLLTTKERIGNSVSVDTTDGKRALPSGVQDNEKALKNAPVQQTVRRNLVRGARKPINYAEGETFATTKIPTILPGNSIDPSSTIVEARTVQQTMRRSRKKTAGATVAPTPTCFEKPPFDSSKDLVDDFIEIPSTIEFSLEQEYERFKMEKVACEIAAKSSSPAATTEPIAPTLTPSDDLVTREEPAFLSTVDVVRSVVNSEEAAQSSARKFIRAPRSPSAMVRASPESQTVPVSEQIGIEPFVHVTKPSLSGQMGDGLSSQTMPVVQRGQKRGRKENNVLSTVRKSEPERLMIDADVDAKPSNTSLPHDEAAVPASDELDKNSLKVNGSYEQVDADKDDGVPEDGPNRAMFEHEDQVCVEVAGQECNDMRFKPFASFDDADILKKLKDCCKCLGKPSPLQAHALPFLLASRNLLAVSESHAGNVHAYGVPLLQRALKSKKRYVRKQPSPICIVLANSSDAVQQITDSLEQTYGSLRVKIGMAVEDPESVPIMESVRPGVSILVTTPSCLEKMLLDGGCSLVLVSFIVLDGADCMLNNGCKESLRVILDRASTCQQIGVFCSTLVLEIEQLVQIPLPNPDIVKITVSKTIGKLEQLPLGQVVHQIVEVLEESHKDTRLISLLQTFQKGLKNRVLVYVLYKEEALHVEGLLQQRGWKVTSVHGGIFEADRNKAVVSFQKGVSSVLVATDVAARGLAIPNVDYVINYSFPYTLCDYARRLGQTGRTGKRGIMHTFFQPSNQGRAKELVEVLREAGQNVPEELLLLTSPAKKKPRTEY